MPADAKNMAREKELLSFIYENNILSMQSSDILPRTFDNEWESDPLISMFEWNRLILGSSTY